VYCAPQYFTGSTPLVPATDLLDLEIYVRQEPPFSPDDDNVPFAPPEASEYDHANLIPPLSTGIMYHVSLRTVTVWGTKSDISFANRFTFRPLDRGHVSQAFLCDLRSRRHRGVVPLQVVSNGTDAPFDVSKDRKS
jgi:hypothetical protein